MQRQLVIKNPVLDVEEIRAHLVENQIPHKFTSSPAYFHAIKVSLDETNAEIVRSRFGRERIDYEEMVIL